MTGAMSSRQNGVAGRAAFSRALALQAGEFCKSNRVALLANDIMDKGVADPVSRIDREAETLIRDAIAQAYPGEDVVGEEHGGTAREDYWVIDPLDGTVNFLSGLPYWGVCVAWVEGGAPVAGAIHLPDLGVTLSGGVGDEVVGRKPVVIPGGASMAFGVGRNRKWPARERQAKEAQLEEAGLHVVSYGASCVALAHVICGQLAGYVEYHTNLWDCAPGAAMARALGLHVRLKPRIDVYGVDLEIVGPAGLRTLPRVVCD